MSEVCELIQRGAKFKLDDIDGKAALFYAAKHDLSEVVTKLCQTRIDLDITDDKGKNAVYYANQKCSVGALCTLILNGAKFKLDEIDGKSVLFYAAEHDFGWVIGQLRQKGLDFNITDDEGKTAAIHAIQNGNIDAFASVIKSPSFKLDTNNGKAALFYAAEHDLPQVVWHLNFDGFNLDITDDEGNTAVYYAYQKCSVGALCELIDCGAEFELDEIDGKAALFYAAEHDLPDGVRQLHQKDLDLDITDDEGKTAVYYANQMCNIRALCALIDCRAKFKLDDIDGKAALFYAAENNIDGVVGVLRNAGLDLDITDEEGKTAVFYADKYKCRDVLCVLIDNGAEFELDEIDGKAALFYAAENNIDGVLKVLHDVGLDLDITDDKGKTALFYAVKYRGNESVVRALIDAKTDVMITDNDGKTALFYAVENDVIDVLIEKDNIFINARDRYGRTPLFDAVKRTSETTARHLIAKGGHLQLKDKCNLSIFSFFVENCILTYMYESDLQLFASELCKEQQQLKALTFAIFDIIYSQAPLLCISRIPLLKSFRFWLNKSRVLDALDFARRQDFIQESDKGMIDEIKYKISEDTIDVPPILDLLNKLGANPNAVDSDGNTALHYATKLPFFGVLPKTVIGICKKLRNFGSMFDQKNQNNESPILFCLSSNNWKVVNDNKHWQAITELSEVCRFLLDNGSSINETSQSDDSVFHLVMELVKQGLKLNDEDSRRVVLHEVIEILKCFSSFALKEGNEKIVNRSDGDLNTPLHLWASFILPSSQDYTIKLTEDHTFEDILKLILDIFLKCGAKLNLRNENEKTPLHLCKTWSAVKLLIGAGADPNVVDSSKGSPLLVAAKEKTYVINLDCFYPDVSEDPKIFWKTSIDNGLDPWTPDKQAESVLGILIESESFVLAKALVEVACKMNHIQSDSIKLGMLRVICQDVSRRTHWKTILVENILNFARKKRIAVDSPLRLCCRNIVQFGMFDAKQVENQESLQQNENDETSNDDGPPPSKKRRKEDEKDDSNWEPVTYDSVHFKIAKQLIVYGVDVSIRDTSGESCLDIAEAYSALKDLLTKPIDFDIIPTLIPWTSVTDRYKNVLEKVARRQECEIVDQIWYHRDVIGSGSFAHIFAGINEKDGREVAVKRIETLRMQGSQDKREIKNLTALADCQHVVRYVNFFQDEHFSYIVLELMEGDIDDYFKGSTYCVKKHHTIQLCQDVVMGIEYLHQHNILHRDLKPGNILYNKELCLKIADFGLSCRIVSTGSTSVMSTRSGTKCWIAPEVLMSSPTEYSISSDMFSCGLVLYYILMKQKHPFNPTDCANKSELQVANETEANIMNGNMEGWDNSLFPEATNLLKLILEDDSTLRPSAGKALDHPFFWSEMKMIDFLRTVGNQQEFECPRQKRTPSLTAVETDLENSITGTLVKRGRWNDSRFLHMPAIYARMTTKTKKSEKIRKSYDTSSVVELVRFLRNVYEHFKDKTFPPTVPIEQLLFEDFVFLGYFPNLVIDVYNAVTTHGWNTRILIKNAMDKKQVTSNKLCDCMGEN